MAEIWLRIKRVLSRLFEYVWGYLGTLSAMGLLLGVLGMGIYHASHLDSEIVGVRCYSGMFNTAGPDIPKGLGELPTEDNEGRVAHIRFEYGGADNRLLRIRHLDARGELSPMPGSRVAEQRLEYDAGGRVKSRSNYGMFGERVVDGAGVAVREFEYDGDGRLIARIFRDARGRKIVPRMPGFAEERRGYDNQGRLSSVQYFDGAGKPIVNARGESHVKYSYDDDKQEELRSNYVNGKLADNADGVAVERICRTKNGLIAHTSWRNAAGDNVCRAGCDTVSLLEEYLPSEQLRRTRRCGQDGVMMSHGRVWAEHLVRTTPGGAIEWECFNGSDGLPCLNPALGYAERVCEYGADGRLESEYFWDSEGNPSPCYEKRHTREHGAHHVLSLHVDGSTELEREP